MTLVDLHTEPRVADQQMAAVLWLVSGRRLQAEHRGTGLYVVGSYNFHAYLHGLLVSEYPFDPFDKIPRDLTGEERDAALRAACVASDEPTRPGDYGVCDYPEQLIEKFPIIDTDPRPFVVSFTKVAKVEEESPGGWRWHKWGAYIGDKDPQCEYIADEGPDITDVWCYHIYEVTPAAVAQPTEVTS